MTKSLMKKFLKLKKKEKLINLILKKDIVLVKKTSALISLII